MVDNSGSLQDKIQSLLNITADLIKICFDCNYTLADESIDLEQVSDQLVELLRILKPFKAAAANSLGNGLSADVVDGLLSRCKSEMSRMETMLKRKSGRKRIEGSSSSFDPQTITSLVSSITALREVVEGYCRPSFDTNVGNSGVYINSAIDSRNSKIYNVLGNQHIYNHSASDDADRQKICKWLSAPDPSSNHHDAVKKRGPKTGLWLINGELLKNWAMTPYSFAWLYGIPGCGKSVLCSTVIEEVTNHCKENLGYALAYFYFDFTDLTKQKTSSLIQSFLIQLSFQLPVCPDVLMKLHAACQGGSRQASTSDLMRALESIIGDFHQVYFVIDALDECTDQKELLTFLTKISDRKLDNLHILATSRREQYIEESLTQMVTSHTNLDSDRVDEDIRCYLRATLGNDHRFKKWTQAEHQEIEDTMMERANGMFRWVTCQLDVLAKCISPHKLRKALISLPTTLEETYDRILSRIGKENRSDVVRLLQWLAFSARPLALLEMAEVFGIDRDELRFDPDQRPREPRAILGICSSLVTVSHTPGTYEGDDTSSLFRLLASVRETGTLSLAHLSVKEYLISEQIRNSALSYYHLDEKLANSAISRDCLVYLLQFGTVDCLCNQSETLKSFGRYAAKCWITHARSNDGVIQNDVLKLAERLLFSGAHFNNWITLFDVDHQTHHIDNSKTPRKVPHPLYYASLLGLGQIANEMVLGSALADINLVGGCYGSALAAASAKCHQEIVQMLLENGADVNMAAGEYGSALASASVNGHKEVVQMLLRNGADVNMAGGEYGNALVSASIDGHKEVVQILLENGANVNMAGGCYGSALASASAEGEIEIVQMLLENGADVNMAGGEYGSALVSASAGGHKEIVQILLENGADVNIAGEYYGSAFVTASANGHKEVMQILLKNGADSSLAGGFFGSALALASAFGKKEAVRILLENGADVNMTGGEYGSALASASVDGRKKVVQMLLENGADVNIAGGEYGSSLASASVNGHKEVVQILLENGADVNMAEGRYGSALASASVNGHKEVVQILLENGADVNMAGGEYGSALASASVNGHKDVVQILLRDRADVNMAGGEYGSALASASAFGKKEVVQILLENGADVNIGGGEYGSALVSASIDGHKEVVQILLENGADVNMAGGEYSGALVSASIRGHKEIVQILLENGAEVNIVGGYHGSALASASAEGEEEVVQMLLEKGANVNMVGGEHGSALASASANNKDEIVQILLENGAEVNMAGGYYGSALASASAEGQKEVVQILLENGADVNMAGGYYGSALASASAGGEKEVMQILLENGADVNMVGGYYGSALASASAEGEKEVLQILLENGADVNMAGGYYGSPLGSASAEGENEVVQILLENGANVNSLGGGNQSSLILALVNGHCETAQILIDYEADACALKRTYEAIVQVLPEHGVGPDERAAVDDTPMDITQY